MARVKKEANEEFKQIFEPTREDADALRISLSTITQKRISGRLYSRFDQYLENKQVVRITEDGLSVRDPAEYTRLSKTYQKMQGIAHYKAEELMKTHPEERVKFIEMIKEMGRGLRDLATAKAAPKVADEMEF